MGFSRWDSAVNYAAYDSAVATRSHMSDHELRTKVFTSYGMPKGMDPSKITVRESRDSDFNPKSNAIIIALDVTGSMGIIAEKMARGKLGTLMKGIFDRKPIEDPQVMVMAVGDAFNDEVPLQVSQFEADIKIDESLQNIYIEGNGGGNNFESYDLPWYFAANRTSIDCFEKRNKKGYLFTIGDELPPQYDMDERILKRIFGKNQDIPATRDQALAAAQEKYNVFHVIVEQGNYARSRKHQVNQKWKELLGNRAIKLDNWENISEVILAAMEISEGRDVEDVINSQQSESVKNSVKYAFGD